MKILVTGSNGLLGQKLTDACKKRMDIQLIATARGGDRYHDQKGYVYESLDITNEKEVNEILLKHKPDVVINTAAMTNVDACETDHAGCDALNVSAVKYLASACVKLNAHFIHISTDFIFDGKHDHINETEIPYPISYYGESKLKGERMVHQYAKSWAILRTSLVYGVVNDMSRSNIVLWAKNSLEQNKEINVVDDQFRTPTFAEDLAAGCLLAAEQKASGVYNISGKDFMSIYELVERVAAYWQLSTSTMKRAKSDDIKQPAKRPPITGFDVSKAERELGYKPHLFEEGLALVDAQIKRSAGV